MSVAGTLQLSAPSSYSGPTYINSGIVQLVSSTTSLSGFGSDGNGAGTGWTVNTFATGSPRNNAISSNVLTLTNGYNGQGTSAFYDIPVPASAQFSASFTYTVPGATRGNVADGMTFTLQNQGLNAIGGGGGGLAYTGISPSVAIAFDIYGGAGTNFFSGGNNSGFNSTTAANVNPDEGDPIQVTLSYDGSKYLTENLYDTVTSGTYSQTYTVGSLASTVSGGMAYIGFTGACGGVNSTQQISNFAFTATPVNVLPSASPVYLAAGTTLDLGGVTQQTGGLNNAAPGSTGNVINSDAALAAVLSLAPAGISTYSGSIQGGGTLGTISVVVNGTGTQIFAGNNTYTGGTTLAAGVLSLASSGAMPATGTISFTGGVMQMTAANTQDLSPLFSTAASQAYAVDTNGQTITWATPLNSASSSLTKIGAGSLTIPNGGTVSGATTITAGTLQIGNGGTGAAIANSYGVYLSNNSALVFNHSNAVAQTSFITGNGSVTKTGPGTLNLQGPGAYTGPTTISQGVLLANDQSLGYNQVNVVSGGTLQVGTATTPGLTGNFYSNSNAGNGGAYTAPYPSMLASFTSRTPGATQNTTLWSNQTLNTSNNLAYGGDFPSPFQGNPSFNPQEFDAIFQGSFDATTSGTYAFQTGSDDGSSVYVDGNLVVNNAFFQGVTYRSGSISLTPGFHNIVITYFQSGGGLGFAANYQPPGATSFTGIPDSLLASPNPGTNGLGIDTLTGNGVVDLNSGLFKVGIHNGSSVFAGSIIDSVGGGSLFKTGTGTLTLIGNSTYPGATTVNNGTLQLGDGTVGHDPTLATSGITANGTLAYVVGSTQLVNYPVTGTGAMTSNGPGTLQLGAAGPVASTVAVTVKSGTMALLSGAQLLSSNITVQPGGVIDSTAAGGLTIGTGQTLSAGRPTSPATDLNGNVILSGGAVNIGIGVGTVATLTQNNGTFTLSGGSVNFDLSSTTAAASDVVRVSNLNLAAPTYIDVNALSLTLGNGDYPLFVNTGSLSGGTSNLTLNLENVSATGTRQSFNLVTIGSSVDLAVTGNPANLVWSGSVNSLWDLATTMNWKNSGSADKFYNNDAVTFDDTAHTGNVTLTGNFTPGNITFNNNALNYTLSGTGSLSGAIGLTKTGSGTAVLANTGGNQFTGATVIGGGQLILGNANSLQNSAVSVNSNNGLSFLPGPVTFNLPSISGSGSLVLSDTAGGLVTLNLGSNNATTTYSGAITGAGGMNLTGTGTFTLSGNNNFAGTTTINSGPLYLASGNAVQGSTVAMNVNNGLVFGAGIGAFNVGGLSSADNLSLLDTSGSAVTLNVGSNGQSTVFSGALTGSGSLIKTGTGLLSLVGSNIAYTGNTTVSAGTLQLNDAIYFSNGNVPANTLSIARGAMLSFNTDAGIGTFTDGTLTQVLGSTSGTIGTIITGSGTFQKTGAGVLASGQGAAGTFLTFDLSPGGLIDIEGGTLRNGGYQNTTWTNNQASLNIAAGAMLDTWDGHTIYVDALTGAGTITKQQGTGDVTVNIGVANGSGTFSGVIQSPQSGTAFGNNTAGSSISLVKNGTGIEVLTGANTYTGVTTINGGTLQVGNGGSGEGITGTPQININNNSALVFNHADSLTMTAGIAGTGSLTKTGSGTLTLQGPGGYSGPTTIAQGVVVANNQSLGYSLVNVAAGSTLQVGQATTPGLTGNFYNLTAAPNQANYVANFPQMLAYFNNRYAAATQNTTAWSNATLNTGNNLGDCGDFPSGFANNQNQFDAIWQGSFNATTSGSYAFQTGSDDGSSLYIDGQLVVNNSAFQGVTYKSGTISLSAGYHTIDIDYFQGGSGLAFAANYQPPGATSFTGIPDSLLASPNPGTNALGVDGLTGNGTVDLYGGAFTAGIANASTTFAGTIIDSVGGGSFGHSGLGTLTFIGSASYAGATIINNGTLQIGNGGTLGSINSTSNVVTTSNTVNSAILAFNHSDNIVFPQVISGAGGVSQLAPSLLTLTGGNTYTGPTNVSSGTLQVGNGAAIGQSPLTSSVNLSNNASVVFNHADNLTLNATISGNGNMTKTGPGTLSLQAPSTYTGATYVSGGVLQLQAPATTVSGFGPGGTGSNWTVNGNVPATAFTNNVLTLTDNGSGENRTVFDNTKVPVGVPFTASFVYQPNGGADGAAFILQNQGLNALGNTGGALAMDTINPSLAVAFNIYNGNNETQGTNIAANGVAAGGTPNSLTTPQTHNYLATPGLNNTGGVASGDPIQVTLQYDGSNNLTETLTDLTTSGTWTNTYAIGRIATTAAGGTAYVGFTGADGGATSTQTISNFSLTYPTNTLPAATALYIGSSGTVDLSGNSQQVESLRNLAAGSSGTVINSGATASVLSLAPTGTSLFSGSIDGVDSTSPISLVLDGPGKQILSGVNTFTGGTTVESGTLVLGSPTALLTGSSLAVGNGASSLFAPATAGPAVAAGPASAAAVPEPGTLALAAIAAALLSVAAWRRRRS